MDNKQLENNAREEVTCRGCGEEKGLGTLVCWSCFKHRTDIVPLKYSGLGLCEWLKTTH